MRVSASSSSRVAMVVRPTHKYTWDQGVADVFTERYGPGMPGLSLDGDFDAVAFAIREHQSQGDVAAHHTRRYGDVHLVQAHGARAQAGVRRRGHDAQKYRCRS